MKCQKCEDWTKAYLEMYPGRKGYGVCEECYEKSKEFVVYFSPIEIPKFDRYKAAHMIANQLKDLGEK